MRISSKFCLVAPLLLVLSAGCDDDTGRDLAINEGRLELDPPILDFGLVQVNTEVSAKVVIKNTGVGVLTIGDVQEAMGDDVLIRVDCGQESCQNRLIPSSGSAVLNVYFSPTQFGKHTSLIDVIPDAKTLDPQQLEVRGEGVTATLQLAPRNAEFGNVVLDSTKTVPIEVTNNSPIDADVHYIAGNNIMFCGSITDNPTPFCISPTTKIFSSDDRFILKPGESTKLNLQYRPSPTATVERADFLLKACETCDDVPVSVTGQGVLTGFKCIPAELDFDSVNPGSCVERNVTCSNIANEIVTVVDWSFEEASNSSEDFRLEDFGSVFSLEEGESREIEVTYCPGELGPDTARIEIETDNTRIDRRFAYIAVSGTGGGPDINVEPPVLDFGDVTTIAPARRTLSISNLGYGELEVSEIIVDTLNTGVFTATVAGRIVPIGGYFDLTIEFQPNVAGPITSELIIRSTDQDEPEVSVVLRGNGIELPTCNYEIVPDPVNFGHVVRGSSNRRAVLVKNTGVVDCLVTSSRILARSDPGFSLPDGEQNSIRVAPGAAKFVTVEYSPPDYGDHSGFLELSVSSDSEPFRVIPLRGKGVTGALLITPPEVDFGTIAVGCAARERNLTIYNTSTINSQIDSIELETLPDANFNLAELPDASSGPVVLGGGAESGFSVNFQPDRISEYANAIIIRATYNNTPAVYYISLTGRGATNATQVDEFEQLVQRKVDMLMVVDDSGSMGRYQAALADNFGAFIQFATTQNVDYRLAITTTDISGTGPGGRFVPTATSAVPSSRIITPNSLPDPAAKFRENVNVGVEGSGTEQGLQAAYMALSNPLIFGHNAGFLRPDAVLSVIFVSDEDDFSPSSVDFYYNFFVSIKGYRRANLLNVSSIVGDNAGSSTQQNCTAFPGTRYRRLAALTGGMFLSICSQDWSRSLQELSTNAFGLKSLFLLNNQPVESSINVIIDGVSVLPREDIDGDGVPDSNGLLNWEYSADNNAINFSPYSTPEPGANIRVEYSVQCL
ncbi:MAG: choice-of-anchor D domain-containing protein [Myxococcota bacterium]|nr:choice-of-anchor D domain-containing protein [Myxococcota bacterium]